MKGQAPRAGRGRAAAVVASLALHTGVALVMWRWRPPLVAQVPPAPMAVEIDIRTPPAAQPAAAQPPPEHPRAPESGSSAMTAPPRRVPSARIERPHAAARPSEPPAPLASAAPSASQESLPGDGASLRMRTGPLALVPDAATLGRFERSGVIAPSEAPALPKPARGPSFSQRLAARVRDDQARVNVFEGHVHPQLYDVGRASERDFKPAEGHLYADPRAPNTVGRTLRAWARDYLRADPAYLEWRRYLAAKSAREKGSTLEEATALREYDKMIEANAVAAEPIACLLCVVIKPGAAPTIEIGSPSGNAEMDRAAIDTLTRVTLRRPFDSDVKPERACYRFTADIKRIPPLPIVGCGFDSNGHFGCFYPTMKVMRTRVVLESVDYGG